MVREVKTNEELREVIASGRKVVVDFFATWCGPCKMLAPVLEDLSADREDVLIVKADTDVVTEVATEYSIMSVPTLIHFDGGQEVQKSTGFLPKEALVAKLGL